MKKLTFEFPGTRKIPRHLRIYPHIASYCKFLEGEMTASPDFEFLHIFQTGRLLIVEKSELCGEKWCAMGPASGGEHPTF